MSARKPTTRKHLPCPQCEYDLFGLIEEHGGVRCPECGEDVEVDFAIKQVRLRKVRITLRWLVFCVAAFVPVAGAAGLCLDAFGIWRISLLAVSAVIWLAVVEIYRQRHRKVDYAGWGLRPDRGWARSAYPPDARPPALIDHFTGSNKY